jgi:hypothetical protein
MNRALTEFSSSTKLIILHLHFFSGDNVPVDRQLAIESLKRLDEGLYNIYRKVQDLEDYVRKDPESFGKLQLYLLSLDVLDKMERRGIVEIINDYENNTIYVKRNLCWSDALPYRVDIYIGSDNSSRRISESYLAKVREWADDVFSEGYTLVRGDGCFQGTSEESILINAVSEYNVDLRDRLKELKQRLSQKAILLVKSAVDAEFV